MNQEPEYKGEPNLDQFHMINSRGRATGVFDMAIFQHICETGHLFIMAGIPYLYHNGVYRADLNDGAQLKTMIRRLIYPEFTKAPTIRRVYDLFMSAAELQKSPEELNRYPASWVNFKNCFWDPVNRKRIEHSPKYYATNQIPHDFQEKAESTGKVGAWLNFITGEDEGKKRMLLEYAGLCLTRDARQQKMLLLVGAAGSGKSTIIKLIQTMVGNENTASIPLNKLSQRFMAFGLMGKLLNACGDLEISALEDAGTLKQLVGEDTLFAEKKGRDGTFFRSFAKMLFSANEAPVIRSERTEAVYRRLLVLNISKTPTDVNPQFFDELAAELPQFIRLCVDALHDMYERGRIYESDESRQLVRQMRLDSDSTEAFLDTVVKSPEGRAKKSELFRMYEDWCKDAGRQALQKTAFYKALRSKGFSEIKTGGQECFKGISCSQNLPKNLPEWFPPEADDDLPFP